MKNRNLEGSFTLNENERKSEYISLLFVDAKYVH